MNEKERKQKTRKIPGSYQGELKKLWNIKVVGILITSCALRKSPRTIEKEPGITEIQRKN